MACYISWTHWVAVYSWLHAKVTLFFFLSWMIKYDHYFFKYQDFYFWSITLTDYIYSKLMCISFLYRSNFYLSFDNFSLWFISYSSRAPMYELTLKKTYLERIELFFHLMVYPDIIFKLGLYVIYFLGEAVLGAEGMYFLQVWYKSWSQQYMSNSSRCLSCIRLIRYFLFSSVSLGCFQT